MDRELIKQERYEILCNLIEALWVRRDDPDWNNFDLANLPRMTSPQAEHIATFIQRMFDVEEKTNICT
jgi:hypothetical protein